MFKFKSQMAVAVVVAALTGLAGAAQAIDRNSDFCPTGEVKNLVTALCEGNFTGTFIFVKRDYGYPQYHDYPQVEPRHHRMHRHFHSHRHSGYAG